MSWLKTFIGIVKKEKKEEEVKEIIMITVKTKDPQKLFDTHFLYSYSTYNEILSIFYYTTKEDSIKGNIHNVYKKMYAPGTWEWTNTSSVPV